MKTTLLALAAALGVATSAMAEDYPTRPIRVIVPFPAGQASDTIVRLVGDQLGRRLGQPIIVENKPGAGGNLGTEQGARAAADGYTLTIATAALPISKLVYRKLAYDPVKDFDPVTLMTVTPLVLVTRPNLPANNVKELVELARKSPGTLTFASSGQGTSHQLSSELLKALADVDMLHVPYRGSAPAHLDLMGGRVDIMFDNIVPVSPHIQSGKLKALAVTTKERAPALPSVPTMAESGYASFEAVAWFGVLAPAGTPAPIVDRLSREINAVLQMPEVNAKLVLMGANVAGTSPAEFRSFMAAEINKWVPVVKRANIVID